MATELVEILVERRVGEPGNNLELYLPKTATGTHRPGDDLGYVLSEPIPGLAFVYITSDPGSASDVLTTEEIGDPDVEHYSLVLSADLLPGITAAEGAAPLMAHRFTRGSEWAIQIELPAGGQSPEGTAPFGTTDTTVATPQDVVPVPLGDTVGSGGSGG